MNLKRNINYINGFVISQYSPFNGPHTILKDTLITGLKLDGTTKKQILANLKQYKNSQDDILTYIPKNYNVILRIVNWWDDTPKCNGTFSIQPTESEINNNKIITKLINITNNFDFIEVLDDNSTLKYNQGNYKKSNIYSIRIKNSGLNPQYEIFKDIKDYICLKDYVQLSDIYKKLYTLIDIQQINQDIFAEDTNTMKEHYTALNYISNTSNIAFLQAHKPLQITNTNSNPFSQELLAYYTSTNGYYKLNTDKVNTIKQLKIDLQNNLETAIRKSVSRYMPAQTKLWKIIYEGK